MSGIWAARQSLLACCLHLPAQASPAPSPAPPRPCPRSWGGGVRLGPRSASRLTLGHACGSVEKGPASLPRAA